MCQSYSWCHESSTTKQHMFIYATLYLMNAFTGDEKVRYKQIQSWGIFDIRYHIGRRCAVCKSRKWIFWSPYSINIRWGFCNTLIPDKFRICGYRTRARFPRFIWISMIRILRGIINTNGLGLHTEILIINKLASVAVTGEIFKDRKFQMFLVRRVSTIQNL